MLISVKDFKTSDDVIAKAQKIEAKTYYKNKKSKNEATNKLIDNLTKYLQQIAIN
ncbi:13648_t:CDS:1, partial [Racocetra persica]